MLHATRENTEKQKMMIGRQVGSVLGLSSLSEVIFP